MPVAGALNAATASPGRRSPTARTVTRLGIHPSLDLGLRSLLAVRGRAVMLGLALVVTGAALVFALSVDASLDAAEGTGPSDVPDGLPLAVYTLDVVLLLIATLGLVAVALLSVRERMREFGVLKTIGFTPRQIALSVTGGNAAVALLAGLASIPAGLGLYALVYAASGGPVEARVFAGRSWLVLVVAALVALAVATTALPARFASRVTIADSLRYE
jgi:putative ABC transport system permease protein